MAGPAPLPSGFSLADESDEEPKLSEEREMELRVSGLCVGSRGRRMQVRRK